MVCETLRREPRTTSVPVILLTALPGELPRLAGMELGAAAYVHKPFDIDQIIDRVNQTLAPASRISAV